MPLLKNFSLFLFKKNVAVLLLYVQKYEYNVTLNRYFKALVYVMNKKCIFTTTKSNLAYKS